MSTLELLLPLVQVVAFLAAWTAAMVSALVIGKLL